MGTKIRNTVLRKYIKDFIYWRESEENELAKETLDRIISIVGPESEIVEKLKRR